MSERVVWVVEHLAKGSKKWKPFFTSKGCTITWASRRDCRIMASKCEGERQDGPYRAWPYAAKESAQ